MDNTHQDIRDNAESYVALGLPIIPLCSYNHMGVTPNHRARCTTPGKMPTIKQWSKHKNTSEEDIETWFKSNEYMNIGLVLGKSQNYNIVGLDIDGDFGEQLYQELLQDNEVPDTWEFNTGNGRRILFQVPMEMETSKKRIDYKEGHEELAFIAEGQQTVFPPSIHHSGKIYEWKPGCSPFEVDLAMAPSWVLDIVKTRGKLETVDEAYQNWSAPVTIEETSKPLLDGGRSNGLASLVGSLCAKRNMPRESIFTAAMAHNVTKCKPPLKQEEVQAMVDSIYESEEKKAEELAARKAQQAEMTAPALAELFYKNEFDEGYSWLFSKDKDMFYRSSFAEGYWKSLSRQDVADIATPMLIEMDAAKCTMHKKKEVVDAFRVYLLSKGKSGERLLECIEEDKYLCLKNGMLDWRKKELIPWNPHIHNHTFQVQAEYIKEDNWTERHKVVDQYWRDTLKTWLPPQETRDFLQEYIGYCLTPLVNRRAMLFLHGAGSNGKSMFIDAVTNILFKQTAVTTDLESINSQFGKAQLVDKLVYYCADIEGGMLGSTAVIKRLTGGDMMNAEIKNGAHFSFKPIGKMIFSANEMPRTKDKSKGWYDRVKIVPFNRTFAVNPFFKKEFEMKMFSEEGRDVLFHWAVEGLLRLDKQSDFTHGEGLTMAQNAYKAENDSVMQFKEEVIKARPVEIMQDDEVAASQKSLQLKATYRQYVRYCDVVGARAVSEREFKKRLIAQGVLIKMVYHKTSKGRKNIACIINYELNPDYEDFADTEADYNLHISLR